MTEEKNPAPSADSPTTLLPLCPCSEGTFLQTKCIFNIDFYFGLLPK